MLNLLDPIWEAIRGLTFLKVICDCQGILLISSGVTIDSLTSQDILDLEYVVNYTDLIGLSFVDDPDDVFMLHEELNKRGKPDIPVILKIETRRAFERLPSILLAAMQGFPLGVM